MYVSTSAVTFEVNWNCLCIMTFSRCPPCPECPFNSASCSQLLSLVWEKWKSVLQPSCSSLPTGQASWTPSVAEIGCCRNWVGDEIEAVLIQTENWVKCWCKQLKWNIARHCYWTHGIIPSSFSSVFSETFWSTLKSVGCCVTCSLFIDVASSLRLYSVEW